MASKNQRYNERAGRPCVKVDWEQVGKWIAGGSKGVQIAARLGIDNDTLYAACQRDLGMGFSDYFQQKRAIGDSMIELSQFELAVKNKNATMLVWLGKQRLGQKETPTEYIVDEKLLGQFEALMQAFENKQKKALNQPEPSQAAAIEHSQDQNASQETTLPPSEGSCTH